MAGIAFNLILIRVGQERTNIRNVRGYSENTEPVSTLRFDDPNIASSQAQTSSTAFVEKEEDCHGLNILEKVGSKQD
jgi:hypothetical protein